MRLLVSWLRDFVDVTASAEEIAERLGLRGFELAAIEPFGSGDAVIDLEITANRPDCLSVVGLAREVATAYDLPLNEVRLKPDTTPVGLQPDPESTRSVRLQPDLTVIIDDADLCPRYAALVAEVVPGCGSPSWMANRLLAAGLRLISPIVDITNYVLIELGHPTHAFDLERLAGAEIRVRRAKAGERLTTLDGIARTLDPEMLVIADRDRPQAVAGVMGGALAEVSSTTRLVAFESAYFQPASVRRTSKRLALKTEASSRFERGADINAPVVALHRIAALMDQIGAGRPVEPVLDVHPGKRETACVHLRRARLSRLLGVHVPDSEVERILPRLGLTVAPAGEGWDVTVPTFRVDVVREVDLIEEVGRHYGFDKLPDTFPAITAPAAPPDPRIPRDQLVRRMLTGAGLSEAVTFGLIEARAAAAFGRGDPTAPLAVANPLSAKFDTLRPSLLPGLVDAVAHNRRHGRDGVGLFEVGTTFSASGETRAVAVVWTGPVMPAHWSQPARQVDFFDLKGMVEELCRALGVAVRFAPARDDAFAPGQAAAVVTRSGENVGVAGQVSSVLVDARGLPRQDRVFAADLDLDRLWHLREAPKETAEPLPRYPFVVRDVSIVVSDALPAETIHGTIQAVGGGTSAPLIDVTLFDRYQGKGIPDGSVSLSARMTFQARDRTLTDAEVQASVDAILAALAHEHGAVQR